MIESNISLVLSLAFLLSCITKIFLNYFRSLMGLCFIYLTNGMLPFDSDLEENSVWHELAASSEVIASCPCKVEPASSVRAVDSRGW